MCSVLDVGCSGLDVGVWSRSSLSCLVPVFSWKHFCLMDSDEMRLSDLGELEGAV